MRLLLILLVAAFAVYLFFNTAVGLLMDWYWFQELGYLEVFTRILKTQFVIGLGAAALTAGILFLNASLAIGGNRFVLVQKTPGFVDVREISLSGRFLKWVAGAGSLVLGGMAGLAASSQWQVILGFLHGQTFGKSDPLFGRDIGFYVFKLPVYSTVLRSALFLTLVCLAAAALIYSLAQQLSLRGRLSAGSRARTHLMILGALALILLAASEWLEPYRLMTSEDGLFAGPGYTDVHARIPLARVSAVVTAALSLLIAAAAAGRLRHAIRITVLLYLAMTAAKILYPALMQRFSVAPNELARETPFIVNNIQATRHAYGLDAVEDRQLNGDKVLTKSDIEENDATIRNIRLWDHGPLLDTFSQIQEIRTYYNFASVDNDRYLIDGRLQQTMLSARELLTDSLPTRNWINEHLTFTHGYGATLGPVNRVTSEGLPVLLIKDIPPKSAVPDLRIDRPEIYFGELTRSYAIVKTRAGEFDYPAGEQNVYRNYEGSGGVPVRSFFRKLVFAAGLGSMKILLSGDITAESRVLYYRLMQHRVSRVVPFLRLDRDPYMVISQGRLFWIQDAYTTTDRFPYSQPMEEVGNYIRNSVKVLVDAYHGSIRFYVSDTADPLLQTYGNIFPTLFHPLSEMPEDLRRHIRYPEDIFSIQTAVYSTYHMGQPHVFYNKEDQWDVPALSQNPQAPHMHPYYTIMKLPGEQGEEFILMLPFTPRGKDNLSAWMVARSDADNYGKLRVYLFPKQSLIYGPKQISARLNQDPEISRQISLWDQRGSKVIFGTLLVIPIDESLIYVSPVYLRADAGKIPELKRVVVAYGNQIAMEETLEQSLARIFGTAPGTRAGAQTAELQPPSQKPGQAAVKPGETPGAAPSPAGREELIRQASDHYARAIKAQREGDWATYGEEIRKLGDILQQLSKGK
jgi:hypothetical protein